MYTFYVCVSMHVCIYKWNDNQILTMIISEKWDLG